MSEPQAKSGSVAEFRANWRQRKEGSYNHWRPGKPQNQVQLAFRYHWEVFSEFMGDKPPGRSLEVGCGRGSLSSHFAEHGWEATLLDTSVEVLAIAEKIFRRNGHNGQFVVGDANSLPFDAEQFDVVSSIGLLEHFEDASTAVVEQWRVLRPGGWIFAYIVPERSDNVQAYFNWVNAFLKATLAPLLNSSRKGAKQPIYRNDYGSDIYVPMFARLTPARMAVTGMYSMPMISHSPEFPFSLLPAPLELALVATFRVAVSLRTRILGRHGWLCSEEMGQAFLVAAQKQPA